MSQDTISIRLNGDERRVPSGLNMAALLEELGLDRRMVVVEHNREIVERSKLEQVEVRGGDVVELVHFVGGG
jgi:thiamine biosynthesis protein ThiS